MAKWQFPTEWMLHSCTRPIVRLRHGRCCEMVPIGTSNCSNDYPLFVWKSNGLQMPEYRVWNHCHAVHGVANDFHKTKTFRGGGKNATVEVVAGRTYFSTMWPKKDNLKQRKTLTVAHYGKHAFSHQSQRVTVIFFLTSCWAMVSFDKAFHCFTTTVQNPSGKMTQRNTPEQAYL